MGEVLGCNKSVVGFWGQGKWKPSPEFRAKLRQLADGKRPDRVAESATKIGVPGTRAKPENVAAEEAAQEFVDQCLVAAQGTRRSEDPNQGAFGVYLTAPELLAGYEAWAKANGKPVVPAAARLVGAAAGKSPLVKVKRQGPKHDGRKPMCYFGVKLLEQATTTAEPEPEAPPAPTPAVMPSRREADKARQALAQAEATGQPEAVAAAAEALSRAEQNREQVEQMRALMDRVRSVKTEHVPEPAVQIPHGPDEIAVKLAQLKHFGIGGEHGVDRVAAQAAVGDLHPTGRDVWKWSPPLTAGGVSDADLDATAYQLLVKCMNGLPEEFGYDYKDDVLATGGFRQEDVDAALRHPHRVEIRPESWDKEKRYPILGFHRGDVSVILGMLTPAKPRVIAAYWSSLLTADTHRVNKVGGGGSKKADGLPTRASAAIDRLRTRGCEIPDSPDEKPVAVTYKGQALGKIATSRTTTKPLVQSDYQRIVRKMAAIDRREVAKAG
jgi:hypothetical protein